MARQTRLMISFVALAAAGSLLAACDQQQAAGVPPVGSMEAAMSLDAGPPPPMVYAPAADALDPGQPIRVTALGPAPQRYRYIDDAYEMVDAFGDSPPDYAFDYGGVEPWVWRSEGGYYRVVEAIPGGYREYYYEPQDDVPFLVRDPRYAYAYDGGALVAVYDIYGRVQPATFVVRQADYAGRYYARGRTLHYAALHQERRRPYADQWRASQPVLAAPRHRWARERDRDAEWRRLREERPDVQRAVWSNERQRREASRATEQPRGDRPASQGRTELRATPAAPPARIARDERRDRGQPADLRRSFEAPRQVQRAEAAQQHAAQVSARDAARLESQQRRVQQKQVERQRGEAAQQHAVHASAREAARLDGQQRRAQQQQVARQRNEAQHAERARTQPAQERVRIEPRQERRVEAPNAQAHGRPAIAQPHERAPAPHGGAKGGPKGEDKHDKR